MYLEYIDYQDNLRKSYLQQVLLILLGFIFSVYFILVVFVTAVAPLVGIILGIGWLFCLRFFIRQFKHWLETHRKVKAYLSTHKRSFKIRGNVTYCFLIPFPTDEALNIIYSALALIGKTTQVDPNHGVINGNIRISSRKEKSVSFYVEKSKKSCKVRACFQFSANDDWWDLFLNTLIELNPNVDFGVSLACGDPVVVGVLDLSETTQEISYVKTKGKPSLCGFLIGGALFGEAGAIVGGLSGNHQSVTAARTVYSNELLVRIIYSNGRLWEGNVLKGSQLYNEIMLIEM